MTLIRTKLKILVLAPHPDDLEFGASAICIDALRLGNEVVEVLMTDGHYGTKHLEFRGNRLKKIRERELIRVNNIYKKFTGNQVRIIKLGFIDGFLLINKQSIDAVCKVLCEEKPDVVLAPDPWYSIDLHRDHLNTGRLLYFALKRLTSQEIPKRAYFFYTFKSTISIRTSLKNLKIVRRLLNQHKSQVTPIHLASYMMYRYILYYCRLIKRGHFNQPFRELKIVEGIPATHHPIISCRDRAFYYFFYRRMPGPGKKQYIPTPQELGLM